MPAHRIPPEVRFWRHVNKTETCWLWTGRTAGPHCYGTLSVNRPRFVYAHRFAYEMAYGPIPDGQRVLHRCDTPLCVRPEHLFLGTQADNMHDMRDKGRSSRGERRHSAKLTAQDVMAIRTRYAAGGISHSQLATLYGVSRPTISVVLSRKKWRHIDATSAT